MASTSQPSSSENPTSATAKEVEMTGDQQAQVSIAGENSDVNTSPDISGTVDGPIEGGRTRSFATVMQRIGIRGEMTNPPPPNNEIAEAAPDDAGHVAVPMPGGQRCLLYKVPKQIWNTDNQDMHKPTYISIGPYSYGENELDNRSQEWKQQCKNQVVQDLTEQGNSTALELMAADDTLVTEVKNYYDTRWFENEEAFRQMMIIDGCFLLVTTLHDIIDPAAVEQAVVDPNHIPNQWDNHFRWHDILLYGNQLPFHVVREIYRLLHRNEATEVALNQKIGKVFADSMLTRYTRRRLTDPGNADNVLHLCHKLLAPTHPNRSGDGVEMGQWRRATEYRKLRVKFNKREIGSEGEAQCILDVRVVGGDVVEIPSLDLSPESWRLLRNLMLLENMNKHLGGHVTSYCHFISQLACTGADVSLLMKKGIIVHGEANDETAATKLGNLCDQIIYDPEQDYLKSDWDKLDKYCRNPGWLVWAKMFGYKDWKNPLVWLGVLVAVTVFVCAILQTVYTMK